MFRGILRNSRGDLLMEKFGHDLYDIEYWEDFASEILKLGGSIDLKYVGPLQECESGEVFI